MKISRSYRRRGTPDFPMAAYRIIAGKDMNDFTHYHPETEIGIVIQGSITMQIGGVTCQVLQGDVYIIPPNAIHCQSTFSADASVRSIVFSPDAIRLPQEHFFQQEFVQPLSEERLSMPLLLQPGHPAYETVAAQLRLIDTCRIYEKDYKVKRFAILMNICTALMPYCHVLDRDKDVPDPGNEAVKLCMRCIHNNYYKKLTLQHIAGVCHLHPNYLCAVFKSYTGQTVFEYLNRYRVEVATELLRREDLPMSKIAELVGFRSESLFYQKFKQVTGLTPKAYGRQRKQENTAE